MIVGTETESLWDSKHVGASDLVKRDALFKKKSNDSVVDLSVYSGEIENMAHCKSVILSASTSPMLAEDGYADRHMRLSQGLRKRNMMQERS